MVQDLDSLLKSIQSLLNCHPAASGGYWMACCGEKIFVSRGSVVGSIGVIIGMFGFHEIMDKKGVERRLESV